MRPIFYLIFYFSVLIRGEAMDYRDVVRTFYSRCRDALNQRFSEQSQDAFVALEWQNPHLFAARSLEDSEIEALIQAVTQERAQKPKTEKALFKLENLSLLAVGNLMDSLVADPEVEDPNNPNYTKSWLASSRGLPYQRYSDAGISAARSLFSRVRNQAVLRVEDYFTAVEIYARAPQQDGNLKATRQVPSRSSFFGYSFEPEVYLIPLATTLSPFQRARLASQRIYPLRIVVHNWHSEAFGKTFLYPDLVLDFDLQQVARREHRAQEETINWDHERKFWSVLWKNLQGIEIDKTEENLYGIILSTLILHEGEHFKSSLLRLRDPKRKFLKLLWERMEDPRDLKFVKDQNKLSFKELERVINNLRLRMESTLHRLKL